jgi:hypothetical protein
MDFEAVMVGSDIDIMEECGAAMAIHFSGGAAAAVVARFSF